MNSRCLQGIDDARKNEAKFKVICNNCGSLAKLKEAFNFGEYYGFLIKCTHCDNKTDDIDSVE